METNIVVKKLILMLYYSGTYIAVWLYVCEKTLVIKGDIFLCGKLSQADFNLQRAFINKFLFIRFILISKIKWIYKYFNVTSVLIFSLIRIFLSDIPCVL